MRLRMKVDRLQWALTDYAPEMVALRMSVPDSMATAGLNCEVVPSPMMVFEPSVALMPMTGCDHQKTSMAAMDPNLEAISETVMEAESRVIRKATMGFDSGMIPEVLIGFGGDRAGDHGVTQRQDRNGSEERAPGQQISLFHSHASHLIRDSLNSAFYFLVIVAPSAVQDNSILPGNLSSLDDAGNLRVLAGHLAPFAPGSE